MHLNKSGVHYKNKNKKKIKFFTQLHCCVFDQKWCIIVAFIAPVGATNVSWSWKATSQKTKYPSSTYLEGSQWCASYITARLTKETKNITKN